MPANFTRLTETFRSVFTTDSKHIPIVVSGAHVRTYYPPQTLVISGSVSSLTVPSGATFADILCLEGDVRFWHGPTDPTSSVGWLLEAGQAIQSSDPATIAFFKDSASPANATLSVEYYSFE